MHVGDSGQVVQLIRQVSSNVNCPNNLVVCSANVDEQLVRALISLRGPSRVPYLVAAYADEDGKKRLSGLVRRLESANVHASLVKDASDLALGGA